MAETEHTKKRSTGARAAAILGVVVLAVASVVAAILVLKIVFVLFDANESNAIVEFVDGLAGTLAWVFKDLFVPDSQLLQTVVNYGIAAIVYFAAGSFLGSLLRREI